MDHVNLLFINGGGGSPIGYGFMNGKTFHKRDLQMRTSQFSH